ncbi:hypothetical protein ATO7_15717 [Oceanococcus atlanticus]|uniref:DUF4124 domain-containing protein n=1 Tax=Oceanococcus atlanticus TaxID=1317117 RepID=A0A1Y1SA87_9GAMM|nr:DUF4124 domain-containing protein [Oceanococcus atlanticus]ORE85245.1 hypothetical protein ATO7_15717 [Oceanococcus atlanticus]RZO83979.1 MAG: DUF4124 domain-containing protein [Oceanococcus sp.]
MRALLLILAVATASAAYAKTYRWVDENGRVHYGDRIPAKYAQQQVQTLNDRGVVVNEKNAPKTAEQLAAEQAQREAEAEAKRRQEEQNRYDQFLLSTYATQDQILHRRDEQLAILDSRIASGEKSVAESQATLSSLKEREDRLKAQDKAVPSKLQKQIMEFETVVRTSEAALNAMRAEREKVNDEFERDLTRFIQLKTPARLY